MLRVLDGVGSKASVNVFHETSIVIEVARELKSQMRKIGIKVLVNGVNIAKPHGRGRFIFELADVQGVAHIIFYSINGDPFDYTINGGVTITGSRRSDSVILKNLSIIGKAQVELATFSVENGNAIFERQVEPDAYPTENKQTTADASTPYTAQEGIKQVDQIPDSRFLASRYQYNLMFESHLIEKFESLRVCIDNSASCKNLQADFQSLLNIIYPLSASVEIENLVELEENQLWIGNGMPEEQSDLLLFISDLPYTGNSPKVFSLVVCEDPFKSEWASTPQVFCVDQKDLAILKTGEKDQHGLKVIGDFYKKLYDSLGEK